MARMMKIYIAGPMTGIDNFNYPLFNSTARRLYQMGYTPLNPADSESENTTHEFQGQTWNWYLRRAIKKLADADALCLLPNWQNSKGATLEVHIAKTLEIPLFTLSIENELMPFEDSK
jgi:hypothetical protein